MLCQYQAYSRSHRVQSPLYLARRQHRLCKEQVSHLVSENDNKPKRCFNFSTGTEIVQHHAFQQVVQETAEVISDL